MILSDAPIATWPATERTLRPIAESKRKQRLLGEEAVATWRLQRIRRRHSRRAPATLSVEKVLAASRASHDGWFEYRHTRINVRPVVCGHPRRTLGSRRPSHLGGDAVRRCLWSTRVTACDPPDGVSLQSRDGAGELSVDRVLSRVNRFLRTLRPHFRTATLPADHSSFKPQCLAYLRNR